LLQTLKLAWRGPLVLLCALSVACAAQLDRKAGHDRTSALRVPAELTLASTERVRVADGLANPRGMWLRSDGKLLVALAGEGLEEDTGTGSLALLSDDDGDGRFEARKDILSDRPSRNILDLVRRDEVFGMADIAAGGGSTLVSAAFFGGPSKIFEVSGETARHWATVEGNINAMTYSEAEASWVAVSSSSEEVLRIYPDREAEVLLELPDLPEGQDPVPGYVRYEPRTGDVLISLFSGSPLGEEGGDGTEIVHGAGGIIRLDLDSGAFEWVVAGLTAPTDVAVDDRGRLYILEFCTDFLDPVTRREEMWSSPGHGGFKRFSGRLLRVDPAAGSVELLADDLDGPTNLHLAGKALFIAQGMGTPGRLIPGASGVVPLDGFIDRITLE